MGCSCGGRKNNTPSRTAALRPAASAANNSPTQLRNATPAVQNNSSVVTAEQRRMYALRREAIRQSLKK